MDLDVPTDLALTVALDTVQQLTRDNILLRAALLHAQNQLAWATMPPPMAEAAANGD
jgi:hypothetical protein